MASAFVYWTSDGGGVEGGDAARVLFEWIKSQNNASLIVYGGDVYKRGKMGEYNLFLDQIGGSTDLVCETPGNHEWKDRSDNSDHAVPRGYETFWQQHLADSKQPIDTSKVAGARYEHFIDLNGWRLVFLDTGALEYLPAWPMNNTKRIDWLEDALRPAGRSKIVFAHHSRLSWGLHGDNPGVESIWQRLFDNQGAPLVAMTLAGHDHNVSVYQPRDRALNATDTEHGVQIWVNGAGGGGFYDRVQGTPSDYYPQGNSWIPTFCVTQIELVSPGNAVVRLLSLGNPPRSDVPPQTLAEITYSFP